MEVLEPSQSDNTLLHHSVSQSLRKSLDYINVLLARIPKVPSTIVPSQFAEQALAESISTIPSSTSGTDSSLSTLTTSTSLVSLPPKADIVRIQGLYVSPSMLIDEELQRLWREEIRNRLDLVLYRNISGSTALSQIMMAGKRRECLQPYLLITCGSPETKERVMKLLKKQVWLKDMLKANRITICAQVAPILKSAGLASEMEDTLIGKDFRGGSYSVGLPHGQINTACGLPVLVCDPRTDPVRYCTLGGLILLDGVLYGLTAGHPFISEQEVVSGETSNFGQDIVTADLEGASEVSDDSFFEDGDVFSESFSSPTEPATKEHIWQSSPQGPTKISQRLLSSVEWSKPRGVILPSRGLRRNEFNKEAPRTGDWALLEWPLRSTTTPLHDVIHSGYNGQPSLQTMSTGSRQGEVYIKTVDLGLQSGYLHASPGSLMLENSIIDVQLITLEVILRESYRIS